MTTPETRVADAVNQYTSIDLDGSGSGSAVTPEHDRRGNLTKDPSARNVGDGGGPTGQKFEYDEENRLVSVKRASDNATLLTIKYDALGRRAESTDYVCAGLPCDTGYQPVVTRHVFDGIQTTQEYTKCPSQSWALAREFVWGDRFPQPVALIDLTAAGDLAAGQAEILHHLHDVLGSIVALTNSSGQVVERYTYDPYGQTLVERADPNNGNPTQRLTASRYGNAFAWTGQRYDAGVRLYHFQYRTYLPHLGRWGQRDPAGYVDGTNQHQYARSSPFFGTDPLGLQRNPFTPFRPPDSDPWSPPLPPWVPPLREFRQRGADITNDSDPYPNHCTSVNDRPGGFDFSDACRRHDACYADLSKSKAQCDREFYEDMAAVCRTHGEREGECLWYAYFYYQGVQTPVSDDVWQRTQDETRRQQRALSEMMEEARRCGVSPNPGMPKF